ncbi:MAG: hypothetical protein ABI375_12490 [Rudaea sp.]
MSQLLHFSPCWQVPRRTCSIRRNGASHVDRSRRGLILMAAHAGTARVEHTHTQHKNFSTRNTQSKSGDLTMAKQNDDTRDASLRVSKKMRDNLKAAAAVAGRPLYDVTNEAINNYLASVKSGGARKGKK